ncbi:MAG: hypothetical protein IPP49_13710 [Saprospiraceae bacterium]|nr:hypothetical protein [Saprospiraceae bacterium]
MDHLGFIIKAGELGFTGVEYVNQFFKDKALDTSYLQQMTTTEKAGVKQLLIMVDNEGYLADLNKIKGQCCYEPPQVGRCRFFWVVTP